MKPKFDHVGIVVKNLEKTLEFLSKLFEVELPPSSSPLSKLFRVIDLPEFAGGIRAAMVPTDGPDSTTIDLMEPKGESWLMDFLRANGDMAVAEICFRVDDIEKFYDKVKETGFTPVDGNGEPLVDKKYLLITIPGVPLEIKYFYFNIPFKPNQGPAFEILEVPEVSEEELLELLKNI
jgi:catechol 2,3-dioxygenase-like lactoylglutathione lyase family enzyme